MYPFLTITIISAPSDYEHIFENQDEGEGGKKVEAKQSKPKLKRQPTPKGPSGSAKRVASDQPTALIGNTTSDEEYF